MTSEDASKLQRGDAVRITVLGVRSAIGPLKMLTVGRVDTVEPALDNGHEQTTHVLVYFGSIHGIVRLSCRQLDIP